MENINLIRAEHMKKIADDNAATCLGLAKMHCLSKHIEEIESKIYEVAKLGGTQLSISINIPEKIVHTDSKVIIAYATEIENIFKSKGYKARNMFPIVYYIDYKYLFSIEWGS